MRVGDSVIYENWQTGAFAKAKIKSFIPAPRPTVNLTLEDESSINGVEVSALLGATGEGLQHDVRLAKKFS